MELCHNICDVNRYGAVKVWSSVVLLMVLTGMELLMYGVVWYYGVDRYGAVEVWSCVALLVVFTGMELCGITYGVDRYGAVEVWISVVLFQVLTGMELWRYGTVRYYLWC